MRTSFPSRRRAANWKGGRKPHSGYVLIWMPEHPRAQVNGYALEHVVIAERALGHALPPKAEVHHVDENKSHNENSNLVVCENHAYHSLLHQRQRAMAACGDPSASPCQRCGKYDRQEDLRFYRQSDGAMRAVHINNCRTEMAPPRTHCKGGHALTQQNTYTSVKNPGQRKCRACQARSARLRRQAKHAEHQR